MTKKWKEKKDVYDMVNEKVLSMMQEGKLQWTKNWKGSPDWNHNFQTGTQYSFINNFMLEYDKQKYGYTSNAWLTFKGVQALGGSVKGQKSTSFVVFYNFIEKKEKLEGVEHVIGRIPFLRYYPLFNLDQVDGVDEPEKPEVVERTANEADEMLEQYYKRERIQLVKGGDVASYSPSLDRIKMPEFESFKTEHDYYDVVFHETVHSTGHEKRLNRIESTTFGSDAYSKEELVAEIGSAYLCEMFGIFEQTAKNQVAYLQNWSARIQQDKRLLVSAFGKAEKAVELIEGKEEEENEV